MRLRVFLGIVFVTVAVLAPTAAPAPGRAAHAAPAMARTVPSPGATATAPPVTINEFLPEERGLGECISALPKPGCGSEARGGWRQTLVFLLIVAGLGIIAWRVVAGARRARRVDTPAG